MEAFQMRNLKEYEDAFFNYLLKGDRLGCRELVREFRKSNLSIITLYEGIFKNSLYRVGQLWENNEVGVAVEHFSTYITEKLMNELLPEIMSLERNNKQIVISCVENEQHQVGGKMVADVFEKNCWDTHFLGANTPIAELVKFCNEVKPDMLSYLYVFMQIFRFY